MSRPYKEIPISELTKQSYTGIEPTKNKFADKDLIRCHSKGMIDRQVAEIYKCNTRTVCKRRCKLGLLANDKGHRRYNYPNALKDAHVRDMARRSKLNIIKYKIQKGRCRARALRNYHRHRNKILSRRKHKKEIK